MGFDIYTTALDPGLLDRRPQSPPESPNRTIGRPADERVREGKGIKIHWPMTKHGRARRVLSRSGTRRRYAVPCFRGEERSAHCEAPEEATGAVLLDACYGIQFQEQPAIIEFEWRGEVFEHRPDALVVAFSAKEFWEYKKDHEARDIFFRRRSERITELAAPLGYGYRLLSTSTLSAGWYYRNAIEMRRHAKWIVKYPRWMKDVSLRITGKAPSPASTVLAFVPEDQRLAALFSFLYNGLLVTDLFKPLSLNSHVHPPPVRQGGKPWVWELFERTN